MRDPGIQNRPGRVFHEGAYRRDSGGHASYLFTRVIRAWLFELLANRAMAIALAESRHTDLAMACFEIALTAKWQARDEGNLRMVLAVDYLRLLGRIE